MFSKLLRSLPPIIAVLIMTGCSLSPRLHLRQTDADTFIKDGTSLLEEGAYEQAAIAFTKAIEMDPENAVAWHERGNVHWETVPH